VLCYSDTINLQATTTFSTKVEWYNRVLQFLGDGYQLKRQVSDSGYIYAYATDRYGCSENDSFKVIPIKTKYDPLLPFDLCPGADRTIEFKTLNSHRYTFNWSPTKYIVTGEKTNRIIVKPVDTTVFYVDFVNEYGCAYRDSVQINISKFDPPLVAYAEEDTIYLGQSTVLHVNRDYKNYNWIIPYGLSCTDCTDPIATPENSILYSVEAVNEDGCVERTDVRVIVIRPKSDESDVYISNIFSPNGDRLNDEFRIRSNFLKEVEMVIYDRWGEKIFETFDLNHWWDGTYKGSQLPPDVYAYYFKVRCVDDQTYSKKGNVTIVR
jgi:gliding motility-associated-like protein